jgi:hypothetical protein
LDQLAQDQAEEKCRLPIGFAKEVWHETILFLMSHEIFTYYHVHNQNMQKKLVN